MAMATISTMSRLPKFHQTQNMTLLHEPMLANSVGIHGYALSEESGSDEAGYNNRK